MKTKFKSSKLHDKAVLNCTFIITVDCEGTILIFGKDEF